MNYERYRTSLEALAAGLVTTRMQALLDRGELDEEFAAVTRGIDWLKRVVELVGEPEPYRRVLARLTEARDTILRFYEATFTAHAVVGDAEVADAPEIVIVLGCKDRHGLGSRIDAAIPVALAHPAALVVASGGGFGATLSEAQTIAARLTDAGVASGRILIEEESVDTVANAVFSKLLMRQDGRMGPSGRVLVVTSAFHALRSLNIFRRVFGPRYRVAVLSAHDVDDRADRLKRAAQELASDARSSRDVFGLPDPISGVADPVDDGDEVTLCHQLLLHHDFYRHRYDLLRKFAPALRV